MVTSPVPGTSAEPVRGPRGLQLALPNIVGSVVLLIANLVSGVLTARLLEPQGRGLVTASVTLMGVAGTLGLLGLRDATLYTQARERHSNRVLLGTSLAMGAAFSLPVTGLAALAALVIFHRQGQHAQDVALVAAAFIPIFMLQSVTGALVAGRQQFRLLAVLLSGQSVLYTLTIVVLHAEKLVSPLHVVLAYGVTSAPPLLLALGYLTWKGGVGRPERPLAGELVRYGLRAEIGTLGDTATARLDITILPAFVVASAVGQYAVAISVASLIAVLFGTLGTVVLAAAAARDSLDVVIRATRSVLAAATVVAIGLAASAWLLIRTVYGQAYGPAYLLMLLLLPGIVAWSANYSVLAGLQSIGRPGLASRAQAYGLIVTLAGLSVLLPLIGAAGAALTSSVAYITVLVAAGRQLHRASGIHLWAGVFDPRALTDDIGRALTAIRRRPQRV